MGSLWFTGLIQPGVCAVLAAFVPAAFECAAMFRPVFIVEATAGDTIEPETGVIGVGEARGPAVGVDFRLKRSRGCIVIAVGKRRQVGVHAAQAAILAVVDDGQVHFVPGRC